MANPGDNSQGVKASADFIQPDIGLEANVGFQSEAQAASRPYTRESHLEKQQRDNRRAKVVDGGGFQTEVKINP